MRAARPARLALGAWLTCAALAPTPAGAQTAPPALRAPDDARKAPGDNLEQARETFRRGVASFKRGDYRAALAAFHRSYELSDNAQVLFNLGETYWQLRDYAGAMNAFARYLERGESIAPSRRAALEQRMASLRDSVGRVEVRAAEGASLLLDDEALGPAPLAPPFFVNAGRHKFAASPGVTRTVDVVGGDELAIDLRPAPAEAPPPAAPARPAPRPRTPAPSTAPAWALTATAAALGAGAAVAGAFALGAKRDYDDALSTFPVERDDVDEARARTRVLGATADLLGLAALGTGVAAAYLWLSRPHAPAAAAWRLQIAGPALALHARF
ncbi:MAG TPA: hypothetical protein VFS43_05495 [Polyangiaceae bacterium]|nr:hypothetical protein [Polyangiaceae bacterium]